MSEFETKYHRPEDEEAKVDTDVSAEEVENLVRDYHSLAKLLSPDIKAKFDEIIPKVDNFYDPEEEEWTDLLANLDNLITDLKDASSDQEALEELELDSREELDGLVNVAKNLSKKHN